MEVMGDGDRSGRIQAQKVGDDPLEGGQGRCVLQIADMLADEDLAAHTESDRIFQVRADREEGGQFLAMRTGRGA